MFLYIGLLEKLEDWNISCVSFMESEKYFVVFHNLAFRYFKFVVLKIEILIC